MTIEAAVPEQIPQLLALWKDAFGEWDGFWELYLNTAFSPSRCRCMTEGKQIAASLCWFDTQCNGQKQAYIYAVVTHPAYRGRGLCRRLIEDTHQHLAALGYAAALLVPAEEGLREMYQKMGYRNCTSVSAFSCDAGTIPVTIEAIGPADYARMRRSFLPENSVIQEDENLSFLAQQAEFFKGADFLLAAYRDEDTLHAMELLGNRQAAPGILAALNCTRGEFRAPGGETAFAMFHPLREDTAVPAYFGFAFD